MIQHNIRNIAIIAHVDHGKTTLVDEMLKQSGTFRSNEQIDERVMDSNDLERERGITILAKNTSILYKDVKINIVDTPGHADFGGEVERIMKMVDGVLLLVDAFEGPMPQTKFVLRKALESGIKPVVVINKIDRPEARCEAVVDEVLDLFIDLGADDEQLEFPVVYASAKQGIARYEITDTNQDMHPLLDMILAEVPAPEGILEDGLQLTISSIDYDKYVGRIGIGKITRGSIRKNQEAVLCTADGQFKNFRISKLYAYHGLNKVEMEEAQFGEIVAIAGIESLNIGETVCSTDKIEPLPFIKIDEPTIAMYFIVNDSPFAGKDGQFVTSRHLRDRLQRELLSNVALRVEDTDSPDSFKVSGRGELHLSILIETMRREGYELSVSKPEVIMRTIDGALCEPMEHVTIETPEEFMGVVIETLGQRKGEMINMFTNSNGSIKLEFRIPARGLIGYRSEFMTDTRGNGILNHIFDGYAPHKGEIKSRSRGSLVAFESGTAVTYGLYNAQERGSLFIVPGTEVYEGMIVGENARAGDIAVNVCKRKQLTNVRASGSDDSMRLVPPKKLSLEQALEFIADDELVEVTPKNIRLRKKLLDKHARAKATRG
ncbi:translational GTPase TypA [Geosporobacter ferrireducens]|uniref:Large ribosomal subunit assembly factor BipA n=1 Tax=Geosporobacter ferrireducens TaxID=1424294 RepID=A0A1D8GJE4_9FIRM|nr:translational GTPase TypA [Geosporobacter ferrireducens]AOT71019.1 GTP-binding protein TypA [Geosporobacter ferrireducens]MTI58241.1 translational GTPase TypA [Geosporobacter ferrireducens]